MVASAQRLLPGPPLRGGRQATLRGLPSISDSAVHSLPPSPASAIPVAVQDKITARQPSTPSPFEEDSEFEPGETLLAPESLSLIHI